MYERFQAMNKGKCKIYKIIELFILIFISSFYFEELDYTALCRCLII